MTLSIHPEYQGQVDALRLELAQVIMDMAAVNTSDIHSRQAKEKAIEGLRRVRQSMDGLGIKHSSQLKAADGRA